MADTAEYIRALLGAPRFARQVTGHMVLEEEPASFSQVRRPWSSPVCEVLDRMGLAELYAHQAEACDAVRDGRDVVVTTPTASGKSLVYNLPFLDRHVERPKGTALYLFPLKALAQDQKGTLDAMTRSWPQEMRPRIALYDGDVSDWERAKIRRNPPHALVTNPDMLHLGILPHHERWAEFFANLSLVVLDEAHTYRGVFGAHMAGLLQRLGRICRRYGAEPTHVLCTATLGNPAELGRLLLGREEDPLVVSRSGAPRGRRHMVIMDPEESPATLAINLLQAALHRGLRTIVYCRSRRMTELVSLWAGQKAGRFRSRISAYRAGFLPEERREIEARLSSGELLAVVSTSALELGIDIGSLDVCILVGYPGSVMSTLQRGGRVGRKGQESAVVLVGGEDALDQYLVNNPGEFFRRPPESVFLNPDNEVILARHVECAAAELPLGTDEPWMGRRAVQDAVSALAGRGRILLSASGREWIATRRRPQREVNLRGTGASFSIVDVADGSVIGTVDGHRAFRETHEGAVYLHRGRSYVVEALDLGAHRALAHREDVRWHTGVRTEKSTEILATYVEGRAYGCPVFFGRLRVTEKVIGYERRENGSLTLIDVTPLDMPPQVFETEGFWYAVPEEMRMALEGELYHFMGSIHALEHVSIGLMPLLVMCDRNDLGGISTPMHAQVGGAAVFVYDGLPGGAGLTAQAFPQMCDLLVSVRHTLKECPCENGCPSCIQSPKCGAGNRPLDKEGALFLVQAIMGQDEEAGRRDSLLPVPSRERIREMEAARARQEAQSQERHMTGSSVGQEGNEASGLFAELPSEIAEDPFAEDAPTSFDPFTDASSSGSSRTDLARAGTSFADDALAGASPVSPRRKQHSSEADTGACGGRESRKKAEGSEGMCRGESEMASTGRAGAMFPTLMRSWKGREASNVPRADADAPSGGKGGALQEGRRETDRERVRPMRGARSAQGTAGAFRFGSLRLRNPEEGGDGRGREEARSGFMDEGDVRHGLPGCESARRGRTDEEGMFPEREPRPIDTASLKESSGEIPGMRRMSVSRPAIGRRPAVRGSSSSGLASSGRASSGAPSHRSISASDALRTSQKEEALQTAEAQGVGRREGVGSQERAPSNGTTGRERDDGTREAPQGPVMVFDVETRRSAREVGGWGNACRMGVSVMVCWDGERYRSFTQDELAGFFELARGAGLLVGFNSFRFDYEVLQPFCPYDLRGLPGLDMLAVVRRHLGYGVSLDNLGRATLGCAKSADGLQALRWWKEGRVEEIRSYCQVDVEVTRGLYEFGRDNGYLLFTNKAGRKVRVPVRWR